MTLLEYIDHFGSDLTVVNAARVSLGRVKTEMDEADAKLIRYLATHGHTSPFRHPSMQVRVTAPIFVMRQWVKHRVGMEINEISGRYVEFDDTQCWEPASWRQGAPSIKQGSLAEGVASQEDANWIYGTALARCFEAYQALLALGVCKEQARAVLPLSTMTQCVITASLQAWHHFWRLRSDSHAQVEIQVYAGLIDGLMERHFPVSWTALKEYSR